LLSSSVADLKIDKYHRKKTNDAVANDHWQQSPADAIYDPDDRAHKNNQHHVNIQILYTLAFPGLVNLGHKSKTAKGRANMADHFRPIHVLLFRLNLFFHLRDYGLCYAGK
jgi:hypothetical protein